MPKPDSTEPTPASSFATRRAEREAREAAGETADAPRRTFGLRAGADAENPIVTMTHVRA